MTRAKESDGGCAASARALLSAGAEADAASPDGRCDTPLLTAVRHLNHAVAAALLEAGADPEHRDRGGEGPLALAVRNNPDP